MQVSTVVIILLTPTGRSLLLASANEIEVWRSNQPLSVRNQLDRSSGLVDCHYSA